MAKSESTKPKTKSGGFRNRIVGTGEVNPADVMANPKNYRLHSKRQREVLSEVLDEVGWVDHITINQRTGTMIDGHLRIDLAMERHEKTVPALFVDLSEQEEDLILATFDPITEMATRDSERYSALASGLDIDHREALMDMLSEFRKKAVSEDVPMITNDDLGGSTLPEGQYGKTGAMVVRIGDFFTTLKREDQYIPLNTALIDACGQNCDTPEAKEIARRIIKLVTDNINDILGPAGLSGE
jgi:hypothetical protein